MDYTVFLLLLNAHFIGDFILQSDQLVKLRSSNRNRMVLRSNLIHSLTHFTIMIVFVGAYIMLFGHQEAFRDVGFGIIILTLAHFLIDINKSLLTREYTLLDTSIYVFVIDQILHVISIVLVYSLMRYYASGEFSVLYFSPNQLSWLEKDLIFMLVIFICTRGTSLFINKLIKHIEPQLAEEEKLEKLISQTKRKCYACDRAGLVMGIIERLFILLVVVVGQSKMIGFVLTAKSIARYKKMDDKLYIEYFLMGTFISFISGIIGGMIIKSIHVFPTII